MTDTPARATTVRHLFTGMADDTGPRAKPLANTLLRCRRQAAMTAALKVHRLSAGPFLFTHAVVPIMKRRQSGKIVNLASIAGRGLSESSSSAYAAAKGGIVAFTRKLAFELGPYGVTINAIAPSLTLTERIRPHWDKRSQEAQATEIARTPLRRVAEAADQAKVICFLASSDAEFVTGVTIDVTGGN